MAKRRWRKPLKRPEAMGDLLERAGEDRFAPRRPPLTRIQWTRAVGVMVAERTQPVALEQDVLIVRAATSAWAHELSMLRDVIRDRLATMGVVVRELRFRVGSVDPLPKPPERLLVRRVPGAADLPGPLRRSIESVADDELRETLARAARASLAWERNK
jgi:hypothetical protein